MTVTKTSKHNLMLDDDEYKYICNACILHWLVSIENEAGSSTCEELYDLCLHLGMDDKDIIDRKIDYFKEGV